MSVLSDLISAATTAEEALAAVGPLLITTFPVTGEAVNLTDEAIEGLTALAQWVNAQPNLTAAAANAATDATVAAFHAEEYAKYGPKP
jgi:hypothetical protein